MNTGKYAPFLPPTAIISAPQFVFPGLQVEFIRDEDKLIELLAEALECLMKSQSFSQGLPNKVRLNPMLRLVRAGLMFVAVCALRLF